MALGTNRANILPGSSGHKRNHEPVAQERNNSDRFGPGVSQLEQNVGEEAGSTIVAASTL